MNTSFDMTFAPSAQIVSVVRRFVLSLYERLLGRDELSAQLALATHELLENAVKYNIDDTTFLRVSLLRNSDEAPRFLMTIRTRNRASPSHITTATEIVGRFREAADPALLYQQMILASIASTDGSGLGLARIRAETEMNVDIKVDGDLIEFIAEIERNLGGRS